MHLCFTQREALIASQHELIKNMTRRVATLRVQNGEDVLAGAQRELLGSQDRFITTGLNCPEPQRCFTSTGQNLAIIPPFHQCGAERALAVVHMHHSPSSWAPPRAPPYPEIVNFFTGNDS